MRGAPVVYNFFQRATPGANILKAPPNLIYLLTVDVNSALPVWLTDQHEMLLDLRGDELTTR